MSTYNPESKWGDGVSGSFEDCVIKHDPRLFESDTKNAIDKAYDTGVFDSITEFYNGTFWTYEKFRESLYDEIKRDYSACNHGVFVYSHTTMDVNDDMSSGLLARWNGIDLNYLELLRNNGLDPLFVEVVPSGKENTPDTGRLYCLDKKDGTMSVFVEFDFRRDNPDIFHKAIENHILCYMLNKIDDDLLRDPLPTCYRQ